VAAKQDHRDQRAQWDLLGPKVFQDPLGLKVHKVILESMARQVLTELMALQALQVRQVQKVRLGHKVQWAPQVLKDPLAKQVRLVLIPQCLVLLVRLGLLVLKVQRAQQVPTQRCPVQQVLKVQSAQLVLRVPRVILESLARLKMVCRLVVSPHRC